MENKSKLKKWVIRISILFICYHIISVIVTFCLAAASDIFWFSNIEHTFGKKLRICIDKRGDVYPRWELGDMEIKQGGLDYNIYAYESEDGFFFTYKDDVFYSYGSTGFFVIYADPFKIKLIRDEKLSVERRKIVDRTLSRYSENEFKILTSTEQLTKEEKAAYERLQIKAQKRIAELKKANEYP